MRRQGAVSLGAVSYTHLDVYKRQSLYRDTGELDRSHDVFTRKTGFGAAVEYRADHVERPALQDVYKRQVNHQAS